MIIGTPALAGVVQSLRRLAIDNIGSLDPNNVKHIHTDPTIQYYINNYSIYIPLFSIILIIFNINYIFPDNSVVFPVSQGAKCSQMPRLAKIRHKSRLCPPRLSSTVFTLSRAGKTW